MNFYIFAVLSALQAVSKASNPYYYVPPQLQYHLPQPPQVPAFNSFGNPFTTSTYYVNPHFQYRSFVNPSIHQHHTPIQHIRTSIPQIQAPIPQNYETQPTAPPTDYQGFAYHTRNDNGATSHVLFVSGPQSQTIRSTLFPTFNTLPSFRTTQTNNDAEKAKSYASDMVDSVNKEAQKTTEYPKSIQELYTPPVTTAPPTVEQIQHDPAQFFRSFFQRSEPSVVNFYSRNSNLFVRPVSGFAANTFPLREDSLFAENNPLAKGNLIAKSNLIEESNASQGSKKSAESNERFYSPFINPRFEINPEETTQTTTELNESDKKSENIAQESVITNTRFRINELIDQVEKLTATATTTSTMTPIVVQDEDVGVSSSMQPIVVQETTESSSTTTTEATTTTTTTTTPTTTTTTTEAIKETTEQILEVTTKHDTQEQSSTSNSEESDLMKSLLSLLTQDSLSSTEQPKDVSTEQNKDISTEQPKEISTEQLKDVSTEQQQPKDVPTEQTKDVSTEELKDVSSTEELKDVSTEQTKDISTEESKDVTTDAPAEMNSTTDNVTQTTTQLN